MVGFLDLGKKTKTIRIRPIATIPFQGILTERQLTEGLKAANMEYTIRNVFDPETGEVFDAQKVFNVREDAFQFRKAFHTNDQILRCCECHERATVPGNFRGKVFFRHFPNTSYCILKDASLTEADRETIKAHIASRESKRHKSLKKSIGLYLQNTEGIDPTSVTVDDKYLRDNHEKRRPDVFCEFGNKKIAFEIQISALPAKYIFKRHEFYKNNGIYLMWILDDFDRNGRNQTERDIKYLTPHQNYFFFNDHPKRQSFVVQFKKGLLNSKNQLYFQWDDEFVSLKDLTFDSADFQIYFKSLAEEEEKIESDRNEKEIEPALKLFRQFYITDNEICISEIEKEIDKLDHRNIGRLCLKIAPNTEIFFKCLSENGKPHFLIYLLTSTWFPKNLSEKNETGSNLFENLLGESKIIFKRKIEQLLFINDYRLSNSDLVFLSSFKMTNESRQERDQRIVRALAYQKLQRADLLYLYDQNDGTILSILSAKHKVMIGFGFSNLIGFANNAIHSYKLTWPFIEQAFRHYKIWDSIIADDTKGTFRKKHQEYLNDRQPNYFHQVYLILSKLFPEVYESETLQEEWFQLEILGSSVTKL